jgi:AcrR family transcriptional regulator
MSEPKSGIEPRIVEAAAHLFSRQGFSGTSTREIARLADVNETSVFRYFATKQDIFWAALQSRLERLRIRKELQSALANRGRPEVVVPLIAELFVQIATFHMELIWLLYVGFLELGPGTERACREYLAPIIQAIREYLGSSVKSGTLRDVDPSLATVAFAATVLAHQGLYPLLTATGLPFANTDEAVLAYSRFWLNALMPLQAASSTKPAVASSAY